MIAPVFILARGKSCMRPHGTHIPTYPNLSLSSMGYGCGDRKKLILIQEGIFLPAALTFVPHLRRASGLVLLTGARQATESMVTSLVLNDDVIPRMSLQSIETLWIQVQTPVACYGLALSCCAAVHHLVCVQRYLKGPAGVRIKVFQVWGPHWKQDPLWTPKQT